MCRCLHEAGCELQQSILESILAEGAYCNISSVNVYELKAFSKLFNLTCFVMKSCSWNSEYTNGLAEWC
jgi:hypothetical protein